MSSSQIKYKVGEVYMVHLGEVQKNEVQGHEQGNTRPCLVLSAMPRQQLAIIIPLTSKKPKIPTYFYVEIKKDNFNKLTYDSNALCHQIRVISANRIIKKIGKLSEEDINKIKEVIADLLDL